MNSKKSYQKFIWSGINAQGKKISGEYSSKSVIDLKKQLKNTGITPLNIKKKSESFLKTRKNKIRHEDINFFYRELSSLISAGIPLTNALNMITKNSHKKSLQFLIEHIQKSIQNGCSLSEALQEENSYFGNISISLIHVGEQSGALDIILNHIAEHQEKMERLKNKIKKAFYYPLIVLIVASVVTTALLLWVIPQFSQLFASVGAKLPWLTQVVIHLTENIKRYTVPGILTVAGLFFSLKIIIKRSKKLHYSWHHWLLRLPILGSFYQHSILARCFDTLALTLQAGLPLLNALKLTAQVTGNLFYEKIWLQVAKKIESGESLYLALQEHHDFPNRVVQFIGVGEEAGQLEAMIKKISEHQNQYIDAFVQNLNQWLEPAIMIFLAMVIGTLVISVYLPIFHLGSVI